MVCEAGATWKRRKGLAWKSARGRRAAQSSTGVFGEAGRASCLHGKRRPDGIKPVEQDPGLVANFRSPSEGNRKRTEESSAEPKAKAQEQDRGSLSITIVALESGETNPKKPASSEGRCRVREPSLEPPMEP